MKVNAITLGARAQRWLRFIVGGGINTGFTYLIYLGMNLFLNYQASYFIAYVTGIVFSYWFNARIVFRIPLSWKGLFAYPLVYLLQYIASAFFLDRVVEFFKINEFYAPLIVAILMLPITYMISKFFLNKIAVKNKLKEAEL